MGRLKRKYIGTISGKKMVANITKMEELWEVYGFVFGMTAKHKVNAIQCVALSVIGRREISFGELCASKPLSTFNKTTIYDTVHKLKAGNLIYITGIGDDRKIVLSGHGRWLMQEFFNEFKRIRDGKNEDNL